MGLDQFSEKFPAAFEFDFGGGYVAGTFETLVPAQAHDTRIDVCQAWNSDNIAHIFSVLMTDGVSSVFVANKSVSAGDGVGDLGTWSDLLTPSLPDAFHYVNLPSGWVLKASLAEATSAAGAHITALGGLL